MQTNRLPKMDPEVIQLPRPAPRPLNLSSFVLCGVPCVHPALAWMQQELYRWALAQAQAVNQPSIPERDLAGVWN